MGSGSAVNAASWRGVDRRCGRQAGRGKATRPSGPNELEFARPLAGVQARLNGRV